MARQAAETILHGLVAALAVMLILRAGNIRDPKTRLRFWLLALGCPVLLTPLFWLLFPGRTNDLFRDEWSLLSGSHFSPLAWHGVHAGVVFALALALTGSLLFLRDLLPFALDMGRLRGKKREMALVPEEMTRSAADAAAALGTSPPRLTVIASKHPVLVCRGLRRPVIVTSTGLVEKLAPDELDAAIAHEVCHAKCRDPLAGWVLMVVRAIFFFNPSVQLCARAVAHEIERRADQAAASIAAGPESVARSLRKLTHAGRDHTLLPGVATWHGFRLAAIEERRQALLDGNPDAPAPRWTLPATAIGLGVILFLTVA